MKKILIVAGLVLALAACSDSEEAPTNENTADDGNSTNENNAVDHGIEDKSVGFTLNDAGKVEAADVPEDIAKPILAAYEEYIAAFNAEDIDRYMKVIADEPDSFDREEDRAALTEAFETFDTTYETSDETIVEYEEGRAEVYATINIVMSEPGTKKSTKQTGRQVVVFKEEQGDWKVAALHFIGNQ